MNIRFTLRRVIFESLLTSEDDFSPPTMKDLKVLLRLLVFFDAVIVRLPFGDSSVLRTFRIIDLSSGYSSSLHTSLI